MKRCPACGSVSPDSEVTCGACGSSIADARVESMEQIYAERMADDKQERAIESEKFEKAKFRLFVRKVVGLFVTAALVLAGMYLLFNQNNIYGLFVIIAGLVIFVVVLSTGPFLEKSFRGLLGGGAQATSRV